jgi:hypothetical protein
VAGPIERLATNDNLLKKNKIEDGSGLLSMDGSWRRFGAGAPEPYLSSSPKAPATMPATEETRPTNQ